MLTRLRLENFKSWRDTGEIPLKPITGFFGTNSSGKSSLFQSLLLMKQTDESPGRGIVFHFGDNRTLVDLGDFESVIHKHDTERSLKFSLGWNAKRAFELSKDYGAGTVSEGYEVGFEVIIEEESYGVGKTLMAKEMTYWVPDGRRFGVRRIPGRQGYSLFPIELTFEMTNPTGEAHRFPPFKFHHFPYWTMQDPVARDLSFDLQYGLTLLLRDMYYLGPLRANPHRIYPWSGAQPPDMGLAGESVVDAILSFREQGGGVWNGADSNLIAIDEYVAGWLKRLGLIYDFRVEPLAEGRRIFEVKVRKTPSAPEVLLTDVGFGVSQILPVLVLCFYVPSESTLILEQPEIHLHPSAQAGLADVFIDAWKKNDVQILFESHSEHLLRRLQRRIAEGEIGQDDVGLYFCSMDDSGESSLSHLELDEYGNISNWPKDFFGDQFGEIAAMSEAALRRQVESE